MRRLTGLLTIVLVAVAVTRGAAGQAPAKTVKDGVYSDAQAARGAELYAQHCALCHGPTLAGADGPPLAGVEFLGNWNGLTVADVFDRIRTSMPLDDPGKLSRAQTADIVAHLLKVGKFPAGTADLPSELAALRAIRIVS